MNKPGRKISGIILAAGAASRMGRTKQLLAFQDRSLLSHVIENAKKSSLFEIILVLGHCAREIEDAIDCSGIKIVINHSFQKGQSTSLIKGLENISSDCDAAMFLLGDQPLVTPAVINKITDGFLISDQPIVIPYYKGIRGNPVIIEKSLFHDLKTLEGDTGPRVLFDRFQQYLKKVSVEDKAVLIDIDTMDDYQKLVSKQFCSR